MPATLESIAQEALVLPADERVTLAYRLLASVDADPEPGADAAWDEEIARRLARYDRGETKAIPAAEVFASLRGIVGEH